MEWDLLEGINIATMSGVREYVDGDAVELRRDATTGRLMVVASNECGNNMTRVDLFDLLDWLRYGPHESRIADGFVIEG